MKSSDSLWRLIFLCVKTVFALPVSSSILGRDLIWCKSYLLIYESKTTRIIVANLNCLITVVAKETFVLRLSFCFNIIY